MNEQAIRDRIKAMPECDKNGLILGLIHILYREPDDSINPDKEWDCETIEYVDDLVKDSGLIKP